MVVWGRASSGSMSRRAGCVDRFASMLGILGQRIRVPQADWLIVKITFPPAGRIWIFIVIKYDE